MKTKYQEIAKLVETMEQVNLKEEMLEDMKQNVESYQKKYKNQQKNYRVKRFAAMAAGVLAVVIVGIPVSAKVQSILKERMEQMPKEKIESVVEGMDGQHTAANSFSRDFTEQENLALAELDKQYRQGRFPKGEVLQIDDVSHIEEEKVCYLTTTGTFYFPNREMTEEELLEYLDFSQVMTYGLEERYEKEFAEEIEKQAETEQNAVLQIVEAGGVDEAEATKIGEQWMDKLYPGMREGMDQNTYLWSSEEEPAGYEQNTLKYKNIYMVYFGVMHDYYYFYIDADAGMLASFEHRTAAMEEAVSEEETKKAIEEYFPQAEKQLQDLFGIQSYDTVSAHYITMESGVNPNGNFSYHFVTKDGNDYVLRYWVRTGEGFSYCDTLYPDYIELSDESIQRTNALSQEEEKISRQIIELP